MDYEVHPSVEQDVAAGREKSLRACVREVFALTPRDALAIAQELNNIVQGGSLPARSVIDEVSAETASNPSYWCEIQVEDLRAILTAFDRVALLARDLMARARELETMPLFESLKVSAHALTLAEAEMAHTIESRPVGQKFREAYAAVCEALGKPCEHS